MPPLFTSHEKYSERDQPFNESDISTADVYLRSHRDHQSAKVGNVYTALIDECDRLRYLVLATDSWAAGKKVLLPVGRCTDDPECNRIYVTGLTKAQIADLPPYRDAHSIDADYEAQVRAVYLAATAERSAPVESEVPVELPTTKRYVMRQQPAREAVETDHMPPTRRQRPETNAPEATADLYQMGPDNHRLKLYEERLVAAKQRHKTGEVRVSKRIETQPAETSVSVRREKIVIEIEAVDGATQVNLPDRTLHTGDTAQMDLYEETAAIRKEPVVRQQVNIRKEVEETVERRQADLRRETLDIQKEGSPEVRDRSH